MNCRQLILATLGLATSAAASVTMAPLELVPPPPGRAMVLVPAKAQPEHAIEIAEAAVTVRLVGALAETTVTLVLRNPNDRDMEGELLYPLPPDATLQGYALDVNGNMVDGVPVPKQKARVAFETEQRKGIDPGLAEWSGGNRFKTRISPIPAQGQRKVRLRYTTLVQQNTYRLPLDFDKVGSFKLRVEAVTGQAPQVQSSGLGKLSFAPWQNLFVLERVWHDLALKEDLVIDLPQGVAESPAVEKHGDTFYLARLIPVPQGQPTSLPKPGYIDLIWDCSASMEKVDKEPVFEALRLYFEQNPHCIVRLTRLGNEVWPAPEWSDHAKLLEALKTNRYDGATAELPLALAQEQALCLLVTDGNVNFADKLETAQPGKGNVYALVASSSTDMSALRRWGAIPIDLLRQTPAQALANIPSWQLAGVELDGKPWEGALTNAPNGVVDGSLLLTGKLPAGKHEVGVILRSAEGEKRVSFSVDTAEAVEGTLNRSFHAQNRLASLLLEPDSPARAEKLRQLGEEYGIVTPGTSLLVLENLEQYLTHEVRPPACCPELRAQYDAAIETRMQRNADERKRQLERQLAASQQGRKALLQWYETDFSRLKLPSGRTERNNAAERPSLYNMLVALFRGEVVGNVFGELVEIDNSPAVFVSYVPPMEPAPAPVVSEADGGIPPWQLEERTSAAASGEKAGQRTIRVQGWSSNAPYLAVLKAAADPVTAYYEQRRQHADSPGFYLDCADFFEQAGQRTRAVQVLSNLLEMDWENRSLMRAVAYKLRYMGETEAAITVFRKVAEHFPEEPQSYRDLALALADAGRWQEAADELRKVLELPMDERFHGIEQIAINELAHIVARAQQEGKPVKVDGVDASCLKPIEVDLRVVINWDTDMSDMDLWVTDPKGEKCFYGYNQTRSGGRISRDVIGGYGPEEFLIRKALPGDYKVQAHYYGSGSLKMLAPVTLYAELYTDYGRPTEMRQTLIFCLDGRDQKVDIGSISSTAAPTTSIPQSKK